MLFALLLTVLSIISADVDIGRDNSFKAYMDYRTITSEGTEQYRLQEVAWTDLHGFRRFGANRYMVALGTYYTQGKAGGRFVVTFDTGEFIKCVAGDVKADEHTDESNRFREVNEDLGCIVEFIVDTDELDDITKELGDCSTMFPGKVVSIVEEQL